MFCSYCPSTRCMGFILSPSVSLLVGVLSTRTPGVPTYVTVPCGFMLNLNSLGPIIRAVSIYTAVVSLGELLVHVAYYLILFFTEWDLDRDYWSWLKYFGLRPYFYCLHSNKPDQEMIVVGFLTTGGI